MNRAFGENVPRDRGGVARPHVNRDPVSGGVKHHELSGGVVAGSLPVSGPRGDPAIFRGQLPFIRSIRANHVDTGCAALPIEGLRNASRVPSGDQTTSLA